MSQTDKDNQDTTDVAPEHGYGPVDPKATKTLPKSDFKKAGSLEVGKRVGGKDNGRPFQATITEIGEDTVTLDMNHPFAGKQLHFEIEIVEVVDGPPMRFPYRRRKKGK